MQRRRFIQLFLATTGLWARQQMQASALPAAAASANGTGGVWTAPEFQVGPLPEPLLPLFPLPLVLFPHTNLPLHIFEERYKEMIQDCLQNQWEFGLLLAQESSLAIIGCSASIMEVVRRYPDGRMDILVRGERRFEISELNQEKPYLRGKPNFFDDDKTDSSAVPPEPSEEQLRQQAIELRDHLLGLLELEDSFSKELSPAPGGSLLSFQIMAGWPADLVWKQNLLELRSERQRLVRVVLYFQQLIDSLEDSPDQRASLKARWD